MHLRRGLSELIGLPPDFFERFRLENGKGLLQELDLIADTTDLRLSPGSRFLQEILGADSEISPGPTFRKHLRAILVTMSVLEKFGYERYKDETSLSPKPSIKPSIKPSTVKKNASTQTGKQSVLAPTK